MACYWYLLHQNSAVDSSFTSVPLKSSEILSGWNVSRMDFGVSWDYALFSQYKIITYVNCECDQVDGTLIPAVDSCWWPLSVPPQAGLHNKVVPGRGEIHSSGCCASDNQDEELMVKGALAKRADIKLRGHLSWNSSWWQKSPVCPHEPHLHGEWFFCCNIAV